MAEWQSSLRNYVTRNYYESYTNFITANEILNATLFINLIQNDTYSYIVFPRVCVIV